jgi:hypothetical protein
MPEEVLTCQGCPFYKCHISRGYGSATYFHWCYVDPKPIERQSGESSEAPMACARHPQLQMVAVLDVPRDRKEKYKTTASPYDAGARR